MGWLSNIFGGEERKSYDSAWAALVDQGAQTAAGIFVSPTKALDCTAVAAAVRIRVETLGSCGLFLYKRGPKDERSRANDHPLYALIHDRPNAHTSAAEFVMHLETDVLLEGAGYGFVNRVDGRILEITRLPPQTVAEKQNGFGEPYYEVTLDSGAVTRYPWQDILHIRGSIDFANRSHSRPLSALRQARQAIGLTMALEAHAARLLGNGARPSGVLTAGTKKLDDAAYKRVTASWRGSHTGENAGGTAILEDGMGFTPITFNSVDLEFNSMRIFQSVEIGRACGVPPPMIYELGRATFANAEQMGQAFLTFTLLGRCKLWQGAISRLLTAEEQVEYYPEFEVDALVRADLAARYAAFSQACGGPFLTANEVRGTDNRPNIAGGDDLRPPANAVGVQASAPAKPRLAAVAS